MSSTPKAERLGRDQKLQQKEADLLVRALHESQKEFENHQIATSCANLSEFYDKFQVQNPWNKLKQTESVDIFMIKNQDELGPQIHHAVCIKSDLMLSVYMNNVKLSKLDKFTFPLKVKTIDIVHQICDVIEAVTLESNETLTNDSFLLLLNLVLSLLLHMKSENFKHHTSIWFIYEQIRLMTMKTISYSQDLLIFSSLFYNILPHAYKFFRESGNCIFPCYSTIHKITGSETMSPLAEQRNHNFLQYIRQKFKDLQKCDKTVVLLVDEIHLKPFFDYQDGNIVGNAFDSKDAANSAFAFMINSLFSSYQDVVHILLSCKLSSDVLYSLIRKTILGLEEIGFCVICVLTDNNAINRKAMSFFMSPPKLSIVYFHPNDNARPLFFIFDTVHILKCIRNNRLNQRTCARTICFPPFNFGDISTTPGSEFACANFAALEQLYKVEDNSILKFAYKLSLKALYPSNLKRQNVKLALQIFNSFIFQALVQPGDKFKLPNYCDTSAFIQLDYLVGSGKRENSS